MRIHLGLVCALALAACSQQIAVTGPATGDLGVELMRLTEGETPPAKPGQCWVKDTTPAVIETTTEQIVVTAEQRDATGAITTPATYQTKTQQRLVQDHEEVWFRAPCPEDLTVNFIATLQRALKARGLYMAPVTGIMDATTAESIRRFQANRGLDSPELSLSTAKELGIIATEVSKL